MFIHVLFIRMNTARFQTLSLIKKETEIKLFKLLENNDAIIQLSWGIERDG